MSTVPVYILVSDPEGGIPSFQIKCTNQLYNELFVTFHAEMLQELQSRGGQDISNFYLAWSINSTNFRQPGPFFEVPVLTIFTLSDLIGANFWVAQHTFSMGQKTPEGINNSPEIKRFAIIHVIPMRGHTQHPATSSLGQQPAIYDSAQQPATYGVGQQPAIYNPAQQPATYSVGQQPALYDPVQQPATYGQGQQPAIYNPAQQPATYGVGQQPALYGPLQHPTIYAPVQQLAMDTPVQHPARHVPGQNYGTFIQAPQSTATGLGDTVTQTSTSANRPIPRSGLLSIGPSAPISRTEGERMPATHTTSAFQQEHVPVPVGQSEEDVEPTDPGQEATELDDEGRRQHENRILDEPIRWNSLKEILPLNWESSIREEWECNFKIFVKYGFTEKCYQRSSQLWHLNLGAFPSEQNWNSHGLNYRKKMVQSLFMTGQRYGVINPHPCIHCMTMGVQCRIYNPNLRRKATATFLRRLGTSCALCRFERRRCGEEVT